MSKIVMVGCLEAGYEFIRFLVNQGIKFDYFVTLSRELAERHLVSGFIDFSDIAKQNGIPIYYASSYSLNSREDQNFFKENKFDLLVQGGWQRLFPSEILDTLSCGAIGIHGSSEFLPKGRGRSPINWSLIEGRKRFIMHYFLMKPGIDDGDVFHFEMFDINEWDTCRTLYYKNSIITKRVLLEWIPRLLNGNYKAIPQIGEPSYYPKRTHADCIINWKKSVFEIYDFVRGLTHPYPGAFSYLNGDKFVIWQAQPFDTRITYRDHSWGEIVEVFQTRELLINCMSGSLLVSKYECNSMPTIGDLLIS